MTHTVVGLGFTTESQSFFILSLTPHPYSYKNTNKNQLFTSQTLVISILQTFLWISCLGCMGTCVSSKEKSITLHNCHEDRDFIKKESEGESMFLSMAAIHATQYQQPHRGALTTEILIMMFLSVQGVLICPCSMAAIIWFYLWQ